MTIRTKPWPPGVPCWADLSVPDVDAVKPFYNKVLGWSFEDMGAEFGGYNLAQVKGAPAAGLGAQQPEQQGQQPAWTLYFASDDIDKTADAIIENHGTMLMPPSDVGPVGRMCIATDPTGAAFGVWQAGQHIGAAIVNEPGGLTWEDLRSSDPDTARPMYQAVFGFRCDPMPDAGPDYTPFFLPGEDAPLGGIGGLMGAPAGTPSHWLVYFGVEDTEAAAAAATAAGGGLLAPPFETPYGHMAAITDPAGAVFWVVQTTGEDQPDRSD